MKKTKQKKTLAKNQTFTDRTQPENYKFIYVL